MTSFRPLTFLLFFLCLSANVYSQFDYDSIALKIGYDLEENFTYEERELFSEKFNDKVFLSYILDSEDEQINETLKVYADEILKSDYGGLLYDQIQSYLDEDTYYNFVNYYIDDLKNIYIVFRLFFDDGGINYHQYLFEPSGIAEYTLTDIYLYLSGEYNSQTLKRVLYGMVQDSGMKDGIINPDSEQVKLYSVLGRVNQLRKMGKIDEAREIFFSIPQEKRDEESLIYIELELTDIEDEVAYKNLMERMITLAGENNPSLYLATIDYHFLNEDYEKLISAVDSLYGYTGDELLELYKGNAYWQMDRIEEAENSFLLANEYYPTMPAPYDYLLGLYEHEDEKLKFLNTIDTMAKYLMVEHPLMEEILEEQHPEIVASDEYKAWSQKKSKAYNMKKDSLSNLVSGVWSFDGMEQYDGEKMETTEFWEEGYGKVRPNYSFNPEGEFTSELKGENFEEGAWKVDIANETIDFESMFNRRSKKGKKIIDGGYFKVKDKVYYEIYSLYILSVEGDTLKLYDPTEGILVYKKNN